MGGPESATAERVAANQDAKSDLNWEKAMLAAACFLPFIFKELASSLFLFSIRFSSGYPSRLFTKFEGLSTTFVFTPCASFLARIEAFGLRQLRFIGCYPIEFFVEP
ncbi:uncharacterized protein N7477_009552 [Penicillium maclennaniae]|uniref:uncharacterized protein n=1 Tax=Penicillium maclennaniae TaxID=1343394 RepID=UPI00253F981C|nr:uncharacterized protein N7477_009552 [Penicillium maclennaniae]KAJ5661936.1 hypothetical protein N7477_009552 [Penicillium maclennaniae]